MLTAIVRHSINVRV